MASNVSVYREKVLDLARHPRRPAQLSVSGEDCIESDLRVVPTNLWHGISQTVRATDSEAEFVQVGDICKIHSHIVPVRGSLRFECDQTHHNH